jgi:hypothetical protein
MTPFIDLSRLAQGRLPMPECAAGVTLLTLLAPTAPLAARTLRTH